MGKPLTIQSEDDERIENLRKKLGTSKVGVVRQGLLLLEEYVERQERVDRWKAAAALVSDESKKVNKELQAQSRLRKVK